MLGLHRDKRATHNFSVIWKVREGYGPNGDESGLEAQQLPKGGGGRPTCRAN
jgi:hypothetical protein